MNTHGIPDLLLEIHRRDGDGLRGFIVTGGNPSPTASLTVPPFATQAYVYDAGELVYVDQPAAAVGPLNTGDGLYWLGVTRNTSTAITGWTRQPGTHYAWHFGVLTPSVPNGLVPLAQCTVAGGAITQAVSVPLRGGLRPGGGLVIGVPDHVSLLPPLTPPLPPDTHLYVEGTADTNGLHVRSAAGIGGNITPGYSLALGEDLLVTGQADMSTLHVTTRAGIGGSPTPPHALAVGGTTYLVGNVGIGVVPDGNALRVQGAITASGNLGALDVFGRNLNVSVQAFKPGGGPFLDSASSAVYKADRQPLTDALGTLLALRGYRYTNTHPSHAGLGVEMGLVAEEVQPVLPQWVHTTPDGTLTVGEQGTTALLVEALRAVVARLEALEARLAPAVAPPVSG